MKIIYSLNSLNITIFQSIQNIPFNLYNDIKDPLLQLDYNQRSEKSFLFSIDINKFINLLH